MKMRSKKKKSRRSTKTRNSDRKKPGLERKLGNRESLSGTRKTVEDNDDDDVDIEDNNNNDDGVNDVNDVNDAATKRVE